MQSQPREARDRKHRPEKEFRAEEEKSVYSAARIDYKDAAKLRRYISERGKILPRRVTGNCAKHQRAITLAVKRARHVAILPYVED